MRGAPSRRELGLIFGIFVVLILVFQLEFSFRFTNTSGPSAEVDLKLGLGGSGDDELYYDEPSLDDRPHSASPKLPAVPASRWGAETSPATDARVTWGDHVPETTVISHVPGWTIFDKLFVMHGTVYIVASNYTAIPPVRMITSSGYRIENGEEKVKLREPTDKDMRIITPQEAAALFGKSASRIEGVSFLVNDPPQFITHYYHFAAELLFGLWRTYSSLDPTIPASGHTTLPPPRRLVFPHTPSNKWRDYASMNQYILRGAFPSLSIEFSDDWADRASMPSKAFMYERVVFADRAASMRGKHFLETMRSASEPFELPGSRSWWSTIRTNVVEFSGIGHQTGSGTRSNPVITYVSRQEWGRRMLRKEDHEGLVAALERLRDTHGYELNIVSMDKLSREEQIRLAGRTTIMMGVHGNGLTSLLWMQPTPRSTVIEFFYPQGFAYDYEYTTRALGMAHYGFWGGEHFTSPNVPPVNYPEGFQGNEIPIDGEAVANLVLQRLMMDEEADD